MTNYDSGHRVAIIGGAGFIGHHLALELTAQGAEVEVIDSLQVNNMGAIASGGYPRPQRDLYLRMINERLDLMAEAGVRLVPQDARDYHALGRALDEFQPDVIVMAAAVSHAGRSNKDPYSTFDHSLRTLENALDCARGRKVHFVYLSSSMVYGDFLTPQVTEDHPLNSIGIYGALKVAGEKMVIAYNQVFDLPYTIVRPSALYGPRCVSRRVGQVFIENAVEGKPLRIEGDGSDLLDFTYVDDLVQGLSLAITHPGAQNETFNMTYGGARTVAEVAEIVCKYFPGTAIESVERDELMPFRGTLSVDKARDLLGYDPAFPVGRGFPKYVDWYRELHGLPRLDRCMMRRDDWLSEILGYPVYVVDGASVPPAGEERALLYAKVPATEVARAAELHEHGFGVVDVNVVLTLSEAHALHAGAAAVAPLEPGEADAVLDIAGSCFRLSRFHLDPRVSDADAARIKREWVRSYVRGVRGAELLVAHTDGRPVGFLAVLADGDARVIDLVGVAGEAQGRGVGSALVAAFVERHAPSARELRVGTQVANIPSLSLYQAHGFRISGSSYVLHRHDG